MSRDCAAPESHSSMFEFIRTHQRLMQFLLLILIVPPFAFFGIDGYRRISDDPNAVARVAGHAITQQEFASAHREQTDRLRQQLGRNIDPALFDTPETRRSTLDTLVSQRVLATQAIKRDLLVSDERLRAVIMAIPSLQENGQFSKDRYDVLLRSQNMTPQGFEAKLRQDLAMQTIAAGVSESAFTPKTVLNLFARAQSEQREVQEFLIKSDAFVSQVKLADHAAKTYYEANQREFQVSAQVRVEYVVLSQETLAASIAANPEQIKVYYDQNLARFRQDEQRQVSHILIKPEPDKATAKAKADDVLKQLRGGGDFAALAKKFSQDPGSAAQGGDLGTFGRGAMVKPFEDAAFTLKEGDISSLVESEFGFHIIKLVAIKGAKVKSFDEMRGDIEKEWKKQEAQKKYAESAEAFSNTVYEQSESLKPAADKFKLEIKTTPLFARAGAPPQLSNAKLLDRLFGDDAIKNKRNTEAVETASGTLVSARVLEFKPQAIKPLADVQGDITKQLTAREAQALAKKDGEAKLKAAQASLDAVSFGAAKTVSRDKPEGLSSEALRAVMTPPVKAPVAVGVELTTGDYALYRVNKSIQPEKQDVAKRENLRVAINRTQAEADFSAYLESLKKVSKVELHPENLEKKAN